MNKVEKILSKPIAVLISDLHLKPETMEVALDALMQALDKAEELNVPLIDCGDILDSKDIIRATCANALIAILSATKASVVLINGNHTSINSLGDETSLNFLYPYAHVVDSIDRVSDVDAYLVPYRHNSQDMQYYINNIPEGSRIIAHTGVQGAYMGHYLRDTSSLPAASFANHRVISGHYHMAQNIYCGRPQKGAVGMFSYVGNPYTLTFGEANDGAKGFQVLYDNGQLESIPTNLRKHVVLECPYTDIKGSVSSSDLLWLKVSGPKSELARLNKVKIGEQIIGHSNYRLDLIPNDAPNYVPIPKDTSEGQVLDIIIDSTGETEQEKEKLKSLWRQTLDETN